MSFKLSRVASNEYDELLLLLEEGTTQDIRNCWYSTKHFEHILVKGGFSISKLPNKFVSNAIRFKDSSVWGRDTYRKQFYYCIDEADRKYHCVVDQVISSDPEEETQSTPWECKNLPTITTNHFHSIELKHLKKYLDTPPSNFPPTPANNNQYESTNYCRYPSLNNTPSSATINAPTNYDAATSVSITPTTLSYQNFNKKKNNDRCPLPTQHDGPIGLYINTIGNNAAVGKIFHDHAIKCPQKCCLKLTNRYSIAYQLIEEFSCGYCKKEYVINSDLGGEGGAVKKCGRKVTHISKVISHAAHGAALTTTMLTEFFSQSGIIQASDFAKKSQNEFRKDHVMAVSREQLRMNRIEHNKTVKEKVGQSWTFKHTDKDGVVHNIVCGAVCADGGGETRAYNHRITGKQHCTILFSGHTGKPLAIRHHQLSCVNCSLVLSKLLNEGKRGQDITEEELRHPGKRCTRNTKYSPANAEENAMEDLGKDLLIDPESGKFLPDEEAILCLQVITDGDTKGAKRLIKKQAELVPEFDGKGEQYPDIGHFLKCISGALFKLASEGGFGGVHLLEPARIKTIIADISKAIRLYGKMFKKLFDPTLSKEEQDPELAKHRVSALKHIASIVPHHCGDHSNCSGHCKMIQIRRMVVATHRVDKRDSRTPDKDILQPEEENILTRYAKKARFQGKVMSMSKSGQAILNREISKRVDASNIDRVALTLSSNNCENFFGMLSKFTHGKRINFGQSNSWEAYQFLVVGKRSDDKFEDKVQSHAGIISSYLRDEATERLVKAKEYNRVRQRRGDVKERRKVQQYAKAKDIAKRTTLSGCHKPNKLSPKEACNSNGNKKKRSLKEVSKGADRQTRKRRWRCPNCKDLVDLQWGDRCPKEQCIGANKSENVATEVSKQKKRKNPKCQNCGLPHARKDCTEPTYEPRKKKSNKEEREDNALADLLGTFDTLTSAGALLT